MDYKATAQGVLDAIGGKENIVSAAHCATRLRLVIADNAKVNKEQLENVDGAKGVFEASGQLQIISVRARSTRYLTNLSRLRESKRGRRRT